MTQVPKFHPLRTPRTSHLTRESFVSLKKRGLTLPDVASTSATFCLSATYIVLTLEATTTDLLLAVNKLTAVPPQTHQPLQVTSLHTICNSARKVIYLHSQDQTEKPEEASVFFFTYPLSGRNEGHICTVLVLLASGSSCGKDCMNKQDSFRGWIRP